MWTSQPHRSPVVISRIFDKELFVGFDAVSTPPESGGHFKGIQKTKVNSGEESQPHRSPVVISSSLLVNIYALFSVSQPHRSPVVISSCSHWVALSLF